MVERKYPVTGFKCQARPAAGRGHIRWATVTHSSEIDLCFGHSPLLSLIGAVIAGFCVRIHFCP